MSALFGLLVGLKLTLHQPFALDMIRRSLCIRTAGLIAATSILLGAPMVNAEPDPARLPALALLRQEADRRSDERSTVCEKPEASQRVAPSLGSMLLLAECLDRAGKPAAALVAFREAASLAHVAGDVEREHFAGAHAAELEKRVAWVEIRVERTSAALGLAVRLNDSDIPIDRWDAAVPVDPGLLRVTAMAPERVGWSTTVDAPRGSRIHVDIPVLAPESRLDRRDESASSASPPGGALRDLGYVASSFGVAGLAIGSLFFHKAYDANQQSAAPCKFADPNACMELGKDARDRAKGFAQGATVAFVASGVLLAGGVTLLLTTRPRDSRPLARELKASATASLNGAGVRLEATW